MLDFFVNQLIALSVALSFWLTVKMFVDFKSHQKKLHRSASAFLLPVLFLGLVAYGSAAYHRFDQMTQTSLAHASTKENLHRCEVGEASLPFLISEERQP